MMNLFTYLPFPGAKASRALYESHNSQQALECFHQNANELLGTWLGRTVLIQTMGHWKNDLKASEIIGIWNRALESNLSTHDVWELWCDFSREGISLREEKTLKMWQFQKIQQGSRGVVAEVAHRLGVQLRLILETIIYYYGFNPKYMFSARSMWDMERRYMSLQRLAGTLTSCLFSIYQGQWIVSYTAQWMGISGVLWAKVALTAAVALACFALISWSFYGLQKLLNVPPAEVWGCRNLNYEASSGAFEPLSGCEQRIQKLSQILCGGKSSIAWVRGAAGTGKTCLIQELARRLMLDKLPKELGKPLIFFLNSAKLSGGQYINSVEKLETIQEELEGFEKQVILAIDECHLLDKSVVEYLKSWKDKGIRLIFISNSTDEALQEKWGKDTFESLISHTQKTMIQLDEPCPELLRGMLKDTLEKNPHVKLTIKAQEKLIRHFVGKAGAPRSLSMVLSKLVTEAKLLQQNTQELLDQSNTLESLRIQLNKTVDACDWVLASQLTDQIDKIQALKDKLQKQADDANGQLQVINERLSRLQEIRHKAIEQAQDLHLEKWKCRLLSTVQSTMQYYRERTQECYRGALSKFPFIWDDRHLEKAGLV